MNEIKIYLNPSGSMAELYKDFTLYQESYRNVQISVYVPVTILYENVDGTFLNTVKTGAILTAPNGAKVVTNAEYVKTVVCGNITYAVYTQIMPKEYVLYAGTQIIVCNISNVDNANASVPKIISVTTTQTAKLSVQASAYLDNDELIDPTEVEVIEGYINSLNQRLDKGQYSARAIYQWNSAYTYGAGEITYYPDVGEFGAFVKSITADNLNNPPYNAQGVLNARYWETVLDFNQLNKAIVIWGFNQPVDISDLEWEVA